LNTNFKDKCYLESIHMRTAKPPCITLTSQADPRLLLHLGRLCNTYIGTATRMVANESLF